jgi:octaprenyl-diphosphate synthase
MLSEKDVPRSIKARLKKIPGIKSVYRDIQKDLMEVEEKLKALSLSSNPLISEVNTYLFQNPGKRIRPAIVILCSKLLGYKGNEHILFSTLVEIIHTASLIHDDIIDNSKTRRGEASVHAKWGPNITVLLGDHLYITAIALSLASQYPQVIRILSESSARMIEGELLEYYRSGNLDISESEYLDIIHKKTASLFSASSRLGGLLGQASPEEIDTLTEYGANLGMAFQVIDDLLDFQSTEKVLGKPVLSDVSEGRITLPLIYTLRGLGPAARRQIEDLLERKHETAPREEILRIVKSNGALDYTYQKASEFSLRSQEVISRFPRSAPQESLHLLADFVLERIK